MLTFIEKKQHLFLIMCTINPFGISILFPTHVLGVKKLTYNGSMRVLAFNIYYGAMIFGAMIGGPLVDYIRRDIGKVQFEYLHQNMVTNTMEKRYIEISSWRVICFFGFLICFSLFLLMFTYNKEVEKEFEESVEEQEEAEGLSCG